MCVLLVASVLIPLFSSRTVLVYMYFWAFPSPKKRPHQHRGYPTFVTYVAHNTNIQCFMFSPPTKEGKGNLELHKVDILKAEYHHFLKKGMEKTVLQLEKVKTLRCSPSLKIFRARTTKAPKKCGGYKTRQRLSPKRQVNTVFLQSQIQRIKQMALKI